jgi:C4-dicarboxylate-specific signal transduction histidine kinase
MGLQCYDDTIMTVDPAELQARIRVMRKNLYVCATLFMVGALFHALLFGKLSAELVQVYVAWSLGFVALGELVGKGKLSARVVGVLSGGLSLVAVTLIIHATGGPGSPYFPLLICVPLLIALFTPYTRAPTLASIVATLGALLVLNALAGTGVRLAAAQMTGFVVIGLLAAVGAQTYRRMWDAQKAAQQERVAVLERLAESERRRLRAERERAEVERLVLVGQLAAGVAHEVNNPLAFVKSNLCFIEQELLREGGEALDRDEVLDVLAETQQGVLRIQQIVTDLRRFSREGSGPEERGSPEEAVGEARRLASVRLRSLGEVVEEVEPGLPRVRLGQRHLVQVLVNLLLNAADAVEGASPPRPARIVLRASRVEGGVRLEVEDNGPGLPQEVKARLFEPFFTTKPPGKGTGLGLALCREYVTRAGGMLDAENRAEGGARFFLTLPEAESAPPVAA